MILNIIVLANMWWPRSTLLDKLTEWFVCPDYTSVTALCQSLILPLGRHLLCAYPYCVNPLAYGTQKIISTETPKTIILGYINYCLPNNDKTRSLFLKIVIQHSACLVGVNAKDSWETCKKWGRTLALCTSTPQTLKVSLRLLRLMLLGPSCAEPNSTSADKQSEAQRDED